MPSKAYDNFRYNLVDVDRLVESHEIEKSGEKGKHGLSHLTKSAIVMLCATWELYIEELVEEASNILLNKWDHPLKFPISVQRELSNLIKNSKNELSPLDLAGNSWIDTYKEHVNSLCSNFNTPKSYKIGDLFKRTIGIEKLIEQLSISEKEINDFVILRGDISHRGRQVKYIKVNQVNDYKRVIVQSAIDIDNIVSDFVRERTDNKKPWNTTKQN